MLFGCKNLVNKKGNSIILKKYGIWSKEKRDSVVELELNKLNNWLELVERTEEIVCSGSKAQIILKTDTIVKKISFINPCMEYYSCILIRSRNTIHIHNDTIFKTKRIFYPLDSLENVLKRDIENNGKNRALSLSPEKLIIYISYSINGIEKVSNLLNTLTNVYESITNRTDIKIWLENKINPPPPPPPPTDN